MIYTTEKFLTFETFLDRYCDNFRYELADGELVEIEPTGPHETVWTADYFSSIKKLGTSVR